MLHLIPLFKRLATASLFLSFSTIHAQVVCYAEINMSLNASGTLEVLPDMLLLDPDPAYIYTVRPSHFDCSDLGIHEVVVSQYTLGGILVNSCFSTINIESKFIPDPCAGTIIACHAFVTLSLDHTGSLEITPEMLLYQPPSGPYTYTVRPSRFDCSDLGVHEVVVSQYNSGGELVNSCFSEVTIVNRNDPNPCRGITCIRSLNIVLNREGEAHLTPEMLLSGPSNPGYTYSLSEDFFNCTDIGSRVVYLTATNAAGLTYTCSTTVTIIDRRVSPPPCISGFIENLEFRPYEYFDWPVPPKINVKGIAELSFSNPKNYEIGGDLIFYLSEDGIVSQDDEVLDIVPIKVKKFNSGKIILKFHLKTNKPAKPGLYFLLAQTKGGKKGQPTISMDPYKLPIQIRRSISDILKLRSIIIPEDERPIIEVVPNPFVSEFTPSINSHYKVVQIDIFDLNGIRIFNQMYVPAKDIIDPIQLPNSRAGIYFMTCTLVDGKRITQKLIKTE